MSLDGKDDYVSVTGTQSLKIQKQLTLSAWVRSEGVYSERAHIVSWPSGFYSTLCDNPLKLCAFWYGKSANATTYNLSASSLDLNTWVLTTVTWDDQMVNFYLNGEKVNSIPSIGDGDISPEP